MACVLVKKRKETNKTKSTTQSVRKKLIVNGSGVKNTLAKSTVNNIMIKTKNGEILEFEINDDILETILNLIQPNNDDDLDDEDVYDDYNAEDEDEDNYSDEEECLYFRGVMTAATEHCHDYGIKKI